MVGPRRNLEEMIEEPDLADSLFLGGYRGLKQWSVSQKKVTKDHDDIMAGNIWSMAQTSDKKYLFVSDSSGCLKQIDVKQQKVVRDYGKIHGQIMSIAISSDDKYLFTSGVENNGHVKQFLVSDGQMINDYGATFENDGIRSITTTPDNKYLFAGSNTGYLKQIC